MKKLIVIAMASVAFSISFLAFGAEERDIHGEALVIEIENTHVGMEAVVAGEAGQHIALVTGEGLAVVPSSDELTVRAGGSRGEGA